jgi:hypothetical protein
MGLAAANLTRSEFETIHDHLTSHNPKCRNMHLRAVKYRGGKRGLRYLHAVHVPATDIAKLEGMICGPEVFWHYQIVHSKGRPQLNVLGEHGPDRELDRIGKRFVREILERIQKEQALREEIRTNYLAGQFYLKRRQGGMPSSHRHCLRAVRQQVLNEQFVSKLQPWNLELVCP